MREREEEQRLVNQAERVERVWWPWYDKDAQTVDSIAAAGN